MPSTHKPIHSLTNYRRVLQGSFLVQLHGANMCMPLDEESASLPPSDSRLNRDSFDLWLYFPANPLSWPDFSSFPYLHQLACYLCRPFIALHWIRTTCGLHLFLPKNLKWVKSILFPFFYLFFSFYILSGRAMLSHEDPSHIPHSLRVRFYFFTRICNKTLRCYN